MDARFVSRASLVMAAAVVSAAAQGAPRTVPSVDLQQYVGTSYEIARFPNRFQEQCAGNVTATYALRSDGRIDVINRCRKNDGTIEEAAGVARSAGGDTSNARLKVRFAPAFLSPLPQVWGDYLDPRSRPRLQLRRRRRSRPEVLWILSRVPNMPEMAYQQAVEIARGNGFEVTKLVRTRQSGT